MTVLHGFATSDLHPTKNSFQNVLTNSIWYEIGSRTTKPKAPPPLTSILRRSPLKTYPMAALHGPLGAAIPIYVDGIDDDDDSQDHARLTTAVLSSLVRGSVGVAAAEVWTLADNGTATGLPRALRRAAPGRARRPTYASASSLCWCST